MSRSLARLRNSATNRRGDEPLREESARRILVISELALSLVLMLAASLLLRSFLPGVEEAAVGDVAALPLGHSHGDPEPLLLTREGLAIFLRGQLDPSTIPAQVREQVQAVDVKLPVFHAEALEDVLSASLAVRRFSMQMVAFFAGTALLLAGLGIYGTISFVVNEQRREIAIRLALGAQRGNILRMVLRRGVGLAASYIPALRAMRLDPITTLHSE